MIHVLINFKEVSYTTVLQVGCNIPSIVLNIRNKLQQVFRMKTSACRDETLKNQPNYMRMTPQHCRTILTSFVILLPLTKYALFVNCVQKTVLEGSEVGSAGWLICMQGSDLCCGMLQCTM